MNNRETRNYNSELRVETREDGKASIIGHAAVYDLLSENLGGFREKIDPGAFDSVLKDDSRALINHDSNLILGRVKSGTLRLKVDERGLVYEIDPPNTSYSNDLMESLSRGDIDQSSFGFIVEDDSWDEDSEGRMVRTIKKIKRLFDVSPVTFPAYPDTDVAKRSMDKFKESKKVEPDLALEIAKRKTILKQLEYNNL